MDASVDNLLQLPPEGLDVNRFYQKSMLKYRDNFHVLSVVCSRCAVRRYVVITAYRLRSGLTYSVSAEVGTGDTDGCGCDVMAITDRCTCTS